MISLLLYKREMKGSIKVLLIFAAVITLYVTVIIRMYDPEMMKTLDDFVKVMPELMAAVGIHAGATEPDWIYDIIFIWIYFDCIPDGILIFCEEMV